MDSISVEVQLTGGPVIGLRKDDLVHFRIIKYAEAKRFQTPRLFQKWDAPMNCTGPAPICPQELPTPLIVAGELMKGRDMAEDCLNLTVMAPAAALSKSSLLPVMVYIHGGASLCGGGNLDCYSA